MINENEEQQELELDDNVSDQEVEAELDQPTEVEYYDQDDMPSAVDDAAEVMSNPQADMIDQILDGDLTNAEGSFKDILDTKLNDAMDSRKVELANSVYNGIDDIAEPTYTPDEEELEISAETSDETEIEAPGEEISDETTDSIEQ
tara:strand:- start:6 stop:443 length:438 start_codon:yes stop_codon:yes gene_type:complete